VMVQLDKVRIAVELVQVAADASAALWMATEAKAAREATVMAKEAVAKAGSVVATWEVEAIAVVVSL
jgi:L-lysine 2,3-aminomutase